MTKIRRPTQQVEWKTDGLKGGGSEPGELAEKIELALNGRTQEGYVLASILQNEGMFGVVLIFQRVTNEAPDEPSKQVSKGTVN